MRKTIMGVAAASVLTVAACAGSGTSVSQGDVTALNAHFPGSVPASAFVCYDQQITPPGDPGTASGSVSGFQWELSHLGGKLPAWLKGDIRSVEAHPTSGIILRGFIKDCQSRVKVPSGWTVNGPRS